MNRGKVARCRRMVRTIDNLIDLANDEKCFDLSDTLARNEILEGLLKARSSTSDILLVEGDDDAYRTTPLMVITVRPPITGKMKNANE